jgi:hypothetical protein
MNDFIWLHVVRSSIIYTVLAQLQDHWIGLLWHQMWKMINKPYFGPILFWDIYIWLHIFGDVDWTQGSTHTKQAPAVPLSSTSAPLCLNTCVRKSTKNYVNQREHFKCYGNANCMIFQSRNLGFTGIISRNRKREGGWEKGDGGREEVEKKKEEGIEGGRRNT